MTGAPAPTPPPARPEGAAQRRKGGGRLRTVVVAWLRVLLPLAALVILSTLFLLSRKPDPDAAIPYASVDAEARARDPQITAPTYAGVTSDGARLSVSADAATPTAAGGIGGAQGLKLDWTAADGLGVGLTAPRLAMADNAIRLEGGVEMTTTTGWTVTAPQIEAATDRSRIAGAGGVTATAPFGSIAADSVALRQQPSGGQAPADNLLDFTGRVRLLYQP